MTKKRIELILSGIGILCLLLFTWTHTGNLLAKYINPRALGFAAAAGIELTVIGLSIRIGDLRRQNLNTRFFWFALGSVLFVSALANLSEGYSIRYGTDITLGSFRTIDGIQIALLLSANALISILIMALSEIIGQDVESASKKNLDAALKPYKDENKRLKDENGEFRAKLEASQLEVESLKSSKRESIAEQPLDILDSYEKYAELNSSRNGSGAVLPSELMSKYGKSKSTAYNWYNRYVSSSVGAMKESPITGG